MTPLPDWLVALDTWLAVQVMEGRRFAWIEDVGGGKRVEHRPPGHADDCAMNTYRYEYKGAETPFDLSPFWAANDRSHGDPAAVRRELWRLYPELAPTEAPCNTTGSST